MPAATRPKQIDRLMEQASEALAETTYFEAERTALKALELARQAGDFGRMARIVLPLQEARRQRLQQALDVGPISHVRSTVGEETTFDAGCYLVRPPQVGADARRLRLMAIERNIPVAVVCHEPLTRLGLCPIVAIAPGVTVRTKIDPPEDPEQPDMAWFVAALEELGRWAIDELDEALSPVKRVDALIGRLDAIPEHEGLHHALARACRDAEREAREPK